MGEPTGLIQMSGYRDIETIKVLGKLQGTQGATESVATVFAEVRLSGKAG